MLRDYQQASYDDIRKNLIYYNGVCCVLPCRSGKSYIMLEICKSAQRKNSNVLILAHRNILLNQHKQLINMNNVRINSVFTEANHLGEYEKPNLIIIDEAHISGCESYKKVCDYYKCKIVGFTATPSRLDGQSLTLFQKLSIGVSAEVLIERGLISKYDLYAPKINIDLSNVKMNGSDFNSEELFEIMNKRKIYGDVLENYLKLANGKQAIAYCVNVKHSMEICKLFNDHNIPAIHIDASTSLANREKSMQEFKDGKYKILCNCNLISEGITIPECDCCLLLRPTQSLSLYIQQACRCLTPQENKRAIIIDFVGNVFAHGMPTDTNEWSLNKKIKVKNATREPDVLVRMCNNCYKVYNGKSSICPYCNYDNGKTKKEIEYDNKKQLEKIEKFKKISKNIELNNCKNYKELTDFAIKNNYKIGWVYQRCKLKKLFCDYGLLMKYYNERKNK